MIRTIAAKEFREILRDRRFAWATGLMTLLLFAALVVGWRQYADYQAMQAKRRSRRISRNSLAAMVRIMGAPGSRSPR